MTRHHYLVFSQIIAIFMTCACLMLGNSQSALAVNEYEELKNEYSEDASYNDPVYNPNCQGPNCIVKIKWSLKGDNCYDLNQKLCDITGTCDRPTEPLTDPYECYYIENVIHENFLKRLANDTRAGYIPFTQLRCLDDANNTAGSCYDGVDMNTNTDEVAQNPTQYTQGTYMNARNQQELKQVFDEIADLITMKLTE